MSEDRKAQPGDPRTLEEALLLLDQGERRLGRAIDAARYHREMKRHWRRHSAAMVETVAAWKGLAETYEREMDAARAVARRLYSEQTYARWGREVTDWIDTLPWMREDWEEE